MSQKSKIRVGSRKSELALIQTKHVITLLEQLQPAKEFEIVTMNTLGDKILDMPLPKIGEKSLFTKELEVALSNGCVDFVVHSLKDLPTTLPSGMAIGAVLEREDPRDVLVLRKDLQNVSSLDALPKGSVIGTSSTRRTAQIKRRYDNLEVEDIRGNLNTRLRKLDELNKYQAIVLAAAGLQRMGWLHRITKVLDTDEMLYAVGQGALAIECREHDQDILNLLKPLYDQKTALCIIAERSFLKTLGGGCSAPVAVATRMNYLNVAKHNLTLKGGVWSLNGKKELLAEDAIEFELQKTKTCDRCPYKDITNTIDIENCITDCPYINYNQLTKKLKVEELSIPSDMLENDPHFYNIPVGADFMGKCPFLEQQCVKRDYASIDFSTFNIQQCPYFSKLKENEATKPISGETDSSVSSSSSAFRIGDNNVTLYCGLVKHPDLSVDILKKAEMLGNTLAEKLIQMGASDIMTNAQRIIHGQ